MNEMRPVQEDILPTRLRGLVVLTPLQRFAAMLRERLIAPWRNARQSLAARITLAASVSPTTAVTNSAVDRSSTREISHCAGTSVRYGRIAKPTTTHATTQAAMSQPA